MTKYFLPSKLICMSVLRGNNSMKTERSPMGHSSTYLAILVTQTLTVMTTASNKNFGLGDKAEEVREKHNNKV